MSRDATAAEARPEEHRPNLLGDLAVVACVLLFVPAFVALCILALPIVLTGAAGALLLLLLGLTLLLLALPVALIAGAVPRVRDTLVAAVRGLRGYGADASVGTQRPASRLGRQPTLLAR